ncbi:MULTISPECIES: PP2C family protein-serine/threonine phosphatase [Streptomyces]|uniref:PP2C family protein-serine/threonine phosphatase n=1 Tax=Streptomyces TaxID=1883 RepID=UPI00163CC99A|nr:MULTISPECIES: PP2C family protein-serine/threonine phosphatase [Streptomyces]MBC2878543.1 serine/threonine-protein phosphatase [Streptomyces sp. TYQ1024]UBI35203.1 serine/threonine-protein phosphatase [Streptomyces mobaraensis]UKW27795.1 serine/threonine-protein phosphatase [Streptomyces sp. TYQ1024]
MRRSHGPSGAGPARHRRHTLLAVPLALIAVIVVVDLLSGPDVHLGPLLVVAPAITAAFAGPLVTGAVGALAVAAQVVIGIFHGGLTTFNHEAQIIGLLLISAVVVVFRYAHERHERELAQVRLVADVAQSVLLRPLPARSGPLRMAAVYGAAAAEAKIGGDLYAAVRSREGTRVLIGDVRGKGLDAVGDAALLLGAFRAAAHRDPPLPRLVAHLQNTVYWDTVEPADGGSASSSTSASTSSSTSETFVTAAVLEFPDAEPVVRVINCGHPPPLLLRGGRAVPLTVRDPALPLGLGGDVSEDDYAAESFGYGPGDVLLLYTDGAVEARDAEGRFYPLAERVAGWREDDPRRLVDRVYKDLLAHAGGALDDDVALIAVARAG